MPRPSTPAAKKQQLTLAQLAAHDDILTDALVDHTFYWTTVPKNRTSYHPSRGVREEEITKIIQTHLIVDPDVGTAEQSLLATDGLRKYHGSLKTAKEKEDFRAHLRRYMSIYLPDCPWEVNATNRYTIVSQEASITARRFIRRNETIKYLSGIQVIITPEEEADMSLRKKDFSLVVSSRSKSTSIFMGPARFANHDCDSNARLVTRGQAAIEIIACKNIDVGDEITVTYGESYFGEDNCECLCKTCEERLANGWKPEDGSMPVKKSIEEDLLGYSLRRRRRDSISGDVSRTPSVTPDIRPRVLKSYKMKLLGGRASTTDSAAERPGASALRFKRKLEANGIATPPETPAKKQKTIHYELTPVTSGFCPSRGSSVADLGRSPLSSEVGSGDGMITDATTPPEGSPEPLPSPQTSPLKKALLSMKQEEGVDEVAVRQVPEMIPPMQPEQVGSSLRPTIEPVPVSQILCKGAETPPAQLTAGKTAEMASLADHFAQTLSPMSVANPNISIDASTTVRRMAVHARQPAQILSSPIPCALASKPTSKDRTVSRDSSPSPPRQRQRIAGDYTLTPLLLAQPNTAWIHCTNCNIAFVQQNAYYTRSNCPRCERHSKLYGYVWPKTHRTGPGDKEERVLDHRTVNRFLGSVEEARVRGRRHWKDRLTLDSEDRAESQDVGVTIECRGRKSIGEEQHDSAGPRRSGRVRKVSIKVAKV